MKLRLIIIALMLGLLGTLWTTSWIITGGAEAAPAVYVSIAAVPLLAALVVSLILGLPRFASFWAEPLSLALAPIRSLLDSDPSPSSLR